MHRWSSVDERARANFLKSKRNKSLSLSLVPSRNQIQKHINLSHQSNAHWTDQKRKRKRKMKNEPFWFVIALVLKRNIFFPFIALLLARTEFEKILTVVVAVEDIIIIQSLHSFFLLERMEINERMKIWSLLDSMNLSLSLSLSLSCNRDISSSLECLFNIRFLFLREEISEKAENARLKIIKNWYV